MVKVQLSGLILNRQNYTWIMDVLHIAYCTFGYRSDI